MAAVTVIPDGQAVLDRLNKAVAQNRRLKRLGWAAAVLGGVALLMGQAKPPQKPKVVEAEKFIVRDANGTARAELGLNDSEPTLALFDSKGNRRSRLAVFPDGSSSLWLYDKDGTARAVLRVRPDGEPQLDLYDKKGANGPPPASPDQRVRPAASSAPAAQDERLQKAAAVYRRFCHNCHGGDGGGGRARSSLASIPDFTNPKWQASRTDAQLSAGILNGRGDQMPAFADRVSAEQARDLVAYVRAFNPEKGKAVEAPANDFEKRLRQLQQQWEDLDRQMRELNAEPRKR